jgi:hypothetical protein
MAGTTKDHSRRWRRYWRELPRGTACLGLAMVASGKIPPIWRARSKTTSSIHCGRSTIQLTRRIIDEWSCKSVTDVIELARKLDQEAKRICTETDSYARSLAAAGDACAQYFEINAPLLTWCVNDGASRRSRHGCRSRARSYARCHC